VEKPWSWVSFREFVTFPMGNTPWGIFLFMRVPDANPNFEIVFSQGKPVISHI
jgi:hypothetical protein